MGRRAHHRSPLLAVSLIVLVQLVLAGPVLAADPPDDVVLDGALTVRFVDDGDGSPLAEASITVEAGRPEVDPEPFQVLAGTTDADGRVSFSGVARPADGAPSVRLVVRADRARPNDCGGTETYDATTTVDSGPDVSVELAASASSSCVAFPIIGTVVGADGDPFPVADAVATITYPSTEPETVDVDVAEDGSFAILLRGWTEEGATEVALLVLGEPRQVPGDDGCLDVVADVADVSWTLDAPEAPDPSLVLASPTVVGSVCDGGTGTPAPAPTVTLPPTDGLAATAPAGRTAPAGPVAILVLAGLLAATVLGTRRLSRRGS